MFNPTWSTKLVGFTASGQNSGKVKFLNHIEIFILSKMFWYSNQDTVNNKNFLQTLYDAGLIIQDGTLAQVCSALPLSSKSSSNQQLYRDTVETHAHVYFKCLTHQSDLCLPTPLNIKRYHHHHHHFSFNLAKGNILLHFTHLVMHHLWIQWHKNVTNCALHWISK